jgi:hypothetical protein
MKNIILFFLLMASTASYAQYWKKHATNTHLSFPLTHSGKQFNIHNPTASLVPTNYLQAKHYETAINTHSKGPYSEYVNTKLTKDGTLQSDYVYDLRGNVVKSKLSYSFKHRH